MNYQLRNYSQNKFRKMNSFNFNPEKATRFPKFLKWSWQRRSFVMKVVNYMRSANPNIKFGDAQRKAWKFLNFYMALCNGEVQTFAFIKAKKRKNDAPVLRIAHGTRNDSNIGRAICGSSLWMPDANCHKYYDLDRRGLRGFCVDRMVFDESDLPEGYTFENIEIQDLQNPSKIEPAKIQKSATQERTREKELAELVNDIPSTLLENVSSKIFQKTLDFVEARSWTTDYEKFLEYLKPFLQDALKSWSLRNMKGITSELAEVIWLEIAKICIQGSFVEGMTHEGSIIGDVVVFHCPVHIEK